MTSAGMPAPAFMGAYPIIQEIGAGAFGTVYLARHPSVDALVAIKAFNRIQASDGLLRTQLQQEIRALMAVRSPYCLQVTDVIDTPDTLAFVTEYIRGATLRTILDEHGRLAPPAALNVLWGAAQGLAAVHAAGLVHGDVKPANILVDEVGASRIIDFGLASAPGRLRGDELAPYGSPAYASPEQLEHGYRDARSDIYSLSVTLYELLTGQRPFGGKTVSDFTHAHAQQQVPDPRVLAPELGPDLASLVMHGMSKDPAQRPQDMATFLAWFEHAATATYGDTWRTAGELAAIVGSLAGAGLLASGVYVAATSGSTAFAATGAAVASSAGTAGVTGGVGGILTAKVAAIAVGSVLAVGATTGGVVLAVNSSNNSNTTPSSYSSAPVTSPQAANPGYCNSEPTFTPISAMVDPTDNVSEVVTYTVTSNCSGGQWLSASQYEVSLSYDGSMYLDGYFDFSGNPAWVPTSGRSISLRYPSQDEYSSNDEVQSAIASGSSGDLTVNNQPSSNSSNSQANPSTPPSSGQSTDNTTAQNPQSATTAAPQSAQDADANALATLRRWVQHDSSAVGALEGQWIAQLSSKKIGTPADYTSWTQVLMNHLYYRQRYPNYALLLWSNDWPGSYGPTSKGFFVTIRGVAFPQPGGVLHWCQHQQWQRGDCFAKRLAKTGDPGANVKMLPGT